MPRFRLAPWMVALDVALVLRDLWGKLEPRERRRLAEIARRGRAMTERDKADLRRLVRKLELIDAGRQLVSKRRLRRGRR